MTSASASTATGEPAPTARSSGAFGSRGTTTYARTRPLPVLPASLAPTWPRLHRLLRGCVRRLRDPASADPVARPTPTVIEFIGGGDLTVEQPLIEVEVVPDGQHNGVATFTADGGAEVAVAET